MTQERGDGLRGLDDLLPGVVPGETAVELAREALRWKGRAERAEAQVRAVEALCAQAVQVLWPSANGYPSGWSLDPDAVRAAIAGLSLQEEQE